MSGIVGTSGDAHERCGLIQLVGILVLRFRDFRPVDFPVVADLFGLEPEHPARFIRHLHEQLEFLE